MYIIGIFLTTNEVEVVPEQWLADPSALVKYSTQCWWPTYKSSTKSAKAVNSKEEVDTRTWSEYPLKVLGRYETFDEARRKLHKATDTSNLDTDDEEITGKRKWQRNKFLIEDEVISEEESNKGTLPIPPKHKKKLKKQSNSETATLTTEKTPKSKILGQDCFMPGNFSDQDCPSPKKLMQEWPSSVSRQKSPNITIRNQNCSSPQNIVTNVPNQEHKSKSDLLLKEIWWKQCEGSHFYSFENNVLRCHRSPIFLDRG